MSARPSSWRELLANPGLDGHIVQLYQDANFYGEAISHFVAEGLARGDSAIIVATAPNWVNISRRLADKGFNSDELFRRGQLTLLDADETLPKFLVNGMPDSAKFKSIAVPTIERARAGGKFPRVRWWGEMVNVLYMAGNQKGSTRLEELFDEVGHEQSVAIFCSFLMDKYDPKIYDLSFGDVCRTHSHLIPAEDYGLHRRVVDRAIDEVVGPIEGQLLRSLVSWSQGRTMAMPSSQATLLWVKDAVPAKFNEVLSRARHYENQSLSAVLS